MGRNFAYLLFAILGSAAAIYTWILIDAGFSLWGYRYLQLRTRIEYDPAPAQAASNFPPAQRASNGITKNWKILVSGDMPIMKRYYRSSQPVSVVAGDSISNGHNSIPLRGMLDANGIFVPWRPHPDPSVLISDLFLKPDNEVIPRDRRKKGLCSYFSNSILQPPPYREKIFSDPEPIDRCAPGSYCQLYTEYHGWQVKIYFHATKQPPEAADLCHSMKQFLDRHTTYIDDLGLK